MYRIFRAYSLSVPNKGMQPRLPIQNPVHPNVLSRKMLPSHGYGDQMISFEGWVGMQSNKYVVGTYHEGFREGAKMAWEFLTKDGQLPPKRFQPKELVKNQPVFGGDSDDLEFTILQ